jgi:N-acetylneuraminate synthase/N,N'-diacetyllegionaminate synthase
MNTMTPSILLHGRRLSSADPAYVIAEVGVNHNGDMDTALRLVEAAAAAGADAVKFQTFRAERTAAPDAALAAYQDRAGDGKGSQQALLRQLELSVDQFVRLAEACRDQGLDFMSTAFDLDSLAEVVALRPSALKSPSGEIDNFQFLDAMGATGLPVMLSTGTARLGDVDRALDRLVRAGARDIVVLQCTSSYPAPPESLNLRTLETFARAFARPVGFSDHSEGSAAALAARALGMCVLERHFTLDRSMKGPDHAASMEPADFAAMVRDLRVVEAALGDGLKTPAAAESDVRRVARRSLHAARDIAVGEVISSDAVTALRPAGGLAPDLLDEVVGRRATRAITAQDRLDWTDIGERSTDAD